MPIFKKDIRAVAKLMSDTEYDTVKAEPDLMTGDAYAIIDWEALALIALKYCEAKYEEVK